MFKFFRRLGKALQKSRAFLSGKIRALFGTAWDATTLKSLERVLYEADLGAAMAKELTGGVEKFLRHNKDASTDEILAEMRKEALAILTAVSDRPLSNASPLVLLIVGVNGSGKTTSIGKLAQSLKAEGKSVLIAAGDTFRAAAVEQLSLWAERIGVEIVKSKTGSDAAAVVFDALTAAKARGCDVVLIDTAGRLQNKTDLMGELTKIRKVCDKAIPGSPHETLLVLDATTGQNSLDQARVFHEFTPLTGLIIAKLDGSSKAGIALSIVQELQIPIRFVGIGEKEDDLLPFDAGEFTDALFG